VEDGTIIKLQDKVSPSFLDRWKGIVKESGGFMSCKNINELFRNLLNQVPKKDVHFLFAQ
jgi:hypothetical protein